MTAVSTMRPFPFAGLLPLRALAVTLEMTAKTRFGFFHQAAVHAFVRHLAGSPDAFHTLFAIDAPETGRIDYRPGDSYRFAIYGLPGCEVVLARLVTALRGLPGTAPRTGDQIPLGSNLRLSALHDLFSSAAVAVVADLSRYDLDGLLTETSLWAHAPNVRLRWLSPTRLDKGTDQNGTAKAPHKGEARYCHCVADLEDGLLPRRIYDAAASLMRARGGNAPPRQVPSGLPAPSGHLFWVDTEYRDSAGTVNPLGGLTGELDLGPASAIPEEWLRLLVLGQYLGIGERRAFGFGRYRLETPEGTHTAPSLDPAASLLIAATRDDNLYAAYRAIRDNQNRKGSAAKGGPENNQAAQADGDYAIWETDYPDLPDPDEEEQLADRLERLGHQLVDGDYQPPILNGVVFREPDGDLRGLAIPPFWDRVAQRALVQIIAPALESVFSTASHGYRPGFSRHTAGNAIQRAWREGYRWVYEADIDGFFDNLNWQHLAGRLRALYRDDPAVNLLLAWISAPVDYQGMRLERSRGLPQGAPLSPILANLMLDDLDTDLEHAGFRLVRYADDFVVLCKDRERAEAAAEVVRSSLAELGLVLNEDKSRSVAFEQGFRYLGFLFLNDLVIDTAGEHQSSSNDQSRQPKRPHPGSWLARLTRHPPLPLGPSGPEPPSRSPVEAQEQPKQVTPPARNNEPIRLGHLGEDGQLLLFTGAPILISTSQGRLIATRQDKVIAESPWRQLQAVVCFGAHHITTPALRSAFSHQVPVHFASSSGTYQGSAWSGQPGFEGAGIWLDQQARCADPVWAIHAARQVIAARLRHMRELLRQRQPDGFDRERHALQQAVEKAERAGDPDTLLGIEGAATHVYYQALATTIPPAYGFQERSRRPPLDPFNALLSFGYMSRPVRLYTFFLKRSGHFSCQSFNA